MMNREDKNQVVAMLALISQIGITMMVSILLCTFVGMFIDNKLGTSFVSVIGFFIGSAAGFRSVYALVRKYIRNNTRKTK